MKLSKRERFLISLLFAISIWAIAYKLLIAPWYADFVNTKLLLEDVKVQKAQMDMYLEKFPDLKRQWEALPREETEELLYRDIDDVFMDRNLQSLAAGAGVEIRRMSIGESEESRPFTDEDGKPLENMGIMQTDIAMELSGPDADSIMGFAELVRQDPKSLVLLYVDMQAEYGRGQDGIEEYQGMKGIAEVRYYYEETE